jgi:hypothetical protein
MSVALAKLGGHSCFLDPSVEELAGLWHGWAS